jgi:hypothetical protein
MVRYHHSCMVVWVKMDIILAPKLATAREIISPNPLICMGEKNS